MHSPVKVLFSKVKTARSCVSECKFFIDQKQLVVLTKLLTLNSSPTFGTELSPVSERGALL